MTRPEHKRRATGGKDDWRTPRKVLDAVERLGTIVLDPCAPVAREHQFAHLNITEHNDGLGVVWNIREGVVFVNPPYSACAAWVEKVIAEAAGDCSGIVVLLVAARPGAKWYRRAQAHADAVAEWRGRITFEGATANAPFPSALFAFNVSWRRFAAAMSDVADVYVPTMQRAA